MIYLLLGSNKGDREGNLAAARKLLSEKLQTGLRCSEVLRTEAIGFDGAEFLNQAVAFDKEIDPLELLELTQACEIELGREPHGAEFDAEGCRVYRDRTIDIDILRINELQIHTERLEIPHPQIWSRPFVKILLEQVETSEKQNTKRQ